MQVNNVLSLALILLLSSCSDSVDTPGRIEGGLVAYYSFEDGPGSAIASDASGNGYELALRNMDQQAVWVTDVPSLQATNHYAIRFDGKDDFLEYIINDSPPFDMVGKKAISVSLWVKLDRIYTEYGHPFVSQNNPQTKAGDHWGFYNRVAHRGAAEATQIGMHMPDTELWVGRKTRDGNLLAGTWHHVAVTWQSPDKHPDFFQDGKKLAIGFNYRSMPPAIGGNTSPDYVPLRVGHPIHHSYEPYFAGVMDEVRIYDRKLSDTEISLLATGGVPGDSGGPNKTGVQIE